MTQDPAAFLHDDGKEYYVVEPDALQRGPSRQNAIAIAEREAKKRLGVTLMVVTMVAKARCENGNPDVDLLLSKV